MKKFHLKSGYTLIEMVVYVSILAVISLAIANTIFSFIGSYRNIAALRAIDNSAVGSLERITRDIRGATDIDEINSILASNPGVLVLTSTSGVTTKTTRIYLQNGIIKADVNGTYFGPLTLSSTTVNSLVFTKIDNTISDSVKIDMTISATIGSVTKTKTYHSTILLKGF